MIFGDKKIFAAEIDLIPDKPGWGFYCVWITGKQIGNFNSKEILAPFINPLIASLTFQVPSININLLKDNNEIYELLTNYEIYSTRFNELIQTTKSVTRSFDSHTAFSGEGFDNFLTKDFLFKDYRYFLWGEYVNRNITSELKEVHIEKISSAYYIEILSQIETYWLSI
jgi:hypothetical protein